MINAKEARIKSENSINEEYLKQKQSVEKLIQKANSEGKFEIFLYDSLDKKLEKELIVLDYEVNSFFDQKDGWTIKISW